MATSITCTDTDSGFYNYSGTSTTAENVWITWTGTTTSGSTPDIVWSDWSGSTGTALHTNNDCRVARLIPVETDLQREQRLEAQAKRNKEYEERIKKEAAERKIAAAKAKVLLEECLSPAQKRAFRRWGTVHVVASSGRRYRIEKGTQGNVVEVKDRKNIARFCIHPNNYRIPAYDVMLAQKMLLETDEPRFLKIANKTTIRQVA